MKLSLHFGLNNVNPGSFDGWDGKLGGCINDASAESIMAARAGFTARVITDRGPVLPTVEQFIGEYEMLGDSLHEGDWGIITHAGHGTEDDNDEYFVLWNGILSGAKRRQLLARFREGVRLVLVDDTCYSGGMERGPRHRFASGLRPERKSRVTAVSILKATVVHWAACSSTESAGEYTDSSTQIGHGYNTEGRIYTLKEGQSWREWWNLTAKRVTTQNPFQHPQLHDTEIHGMSFLDAPVFTA